VFDALTTSRSYRKAFSWEKAMNILREEAGTVVDPQLVPVFERLIEREINEQRLTAEGQIAGATIGEGI
jgi:HD-GYP domain-containing protein (c-di-GMP phosphodiesterase class II)